MCTDQIPERTLASKSSSGRTSVGAARRFWLITTNVESSIPSRLTISVSKPYRNGSKINAAPNRPA